MNTIKHYLLIACLSAGMPDPGRGPDARAPTNEAPSAPVTAIQTSTGQPPPAPTAAPEAATNAVATLPCRPISPPTWSPAPMRSPALTQSQPPTLPCPQW